jgi:hypothetical protein
VDMAGAAPGREIALVLDDFQFISSHAVHEQLAFLVEHCPPTLHIVIATRSDPPLPLARLRARGRRSNCVAHAPFEWLGALARRFVALVLRGCPGRLAAAHARLVNPRLLLWRAPELRLAQADMSG